MKKITMSALMASILLTTIPSSLMAVEVKDKTTTTIGELEKLEKSKVAHLRLYEINAMDKTDLTFTQKKQLRNEAKEIKKAYNNGGIYISAGALIVIIILLIILL